MALPAVFRLGRVPVLIVEAPPRNQPWNGCGEDRCEVAAASQAYSRIQAAIAGPSGARVPVPGRGGTGVKDARHRASTVMMVCSVGADVPWWMDSP
jgi:hypothetical protein